MKKAIIISFDLIREGELPISYAVGSILAYAMSQPEYGDTFQMEEVKVNGFDIENRFSQSYFQQCLSEIKVAELDTIFIAAYVWNEACINPLISMLRAIGFRGKIALGGYQITYGERDNLKTSYPGCDVFISGYAEASVVKAIQMDKPTEPAFLKENVDFNHLPSPYGSIIEIPTGQSMVRMETKRGCPYRCTFCAHRDLGKNKVSKHSMDRVFSDLFIFKSKGVKRVNVLDPVFNMGSEYIEVLKEIDRLSFSETTFTFQTRMELIKGLRGEEFLNLVVRTGAHLEFGMQTLIPQEYEVINRRNYLDHVIPLFHRLNDAGISYEVSLIYGLPNQTVESFEKSISILKENGCTDITAFPLMLLKGTELYSEKDKWGMKEEVVGDFGIPMVTSSYSFTKEEWLMMEYIAQSLEPNRRVA